MSGVKRVFVEKKKPFAVNAKELHDEITGYLGIKTITDVRVLIRLRIFLMRHIRKHLQQYLQNHLLMMCMRMNLRLQMMILYFL